MEGVKSKQPFATKMKHVVDFVDVSKLPNPSLKGERPHIKIPQGAYLQGLDYCKHSLIGRLNLSKIPIQRVREMAKLLWKPTGDCSLTSFGKGFFGNLFL